LQLKYIHYVLDWPGDPEIGVPQKVLTQITSWERLGVKVNLYVVSPEKFSTKWREFTPNVAAYSSSIGRLFARRNTNQKILTIKNLNPENSIQYRRSGIFTLSDLITLRKFPTILEINTNNDYFYMQKSSLLGQLIRLQNQFVATYCLGACTVTPELQRMQSKKLRTKSKHFTNTLSNLQNANVFVRSWERPRFIFAGSENFAWNGVERIKWLIRELDEFDFFIAGPIPLNIKSGNLTELGVCTPSKLNSIFNEIDFGLSTLAMEESGLTEAASLKSRTYLGAGMPVIGGVFDSELEKIKDSYFQLNYAAGGDAPSNLTQMREFVIRNIGHRITRNQLEPISAENVEKNRIDFIAQLLTTRIQSKSPSWENHRNG